jgi:hypothetical protein
MAIEVTETARSTPVGVILRQPALSRSSAVARNRFLASSTAQVSTA